MNARSTLPRSVFAQLARPAAPDEPALVVDDLGHLVQHLDPVHIRAVTSTSWIRAIGVVEAQRERASSGSLDVVTHLVDVGAR